MTRAERIEKAAKKFIEHRKGITFNVGQGALRELQEALALPPDPVPRRLTVEDVAALAEEIKNPGFSDSQMADFFNARIFGETK